MAAMRRIQHSTSHHHSSSSSSSLLPPHTKSILKRRRSPSPQSNGDDDDDDDDDDAGKRASYRNPASQLSSSPPPSKAATMIKQRSCGKGHRKSKKQAVMHESSMEDHATSSTLPSIKRTRFAGATACKFAKAGCPFTGSQDEVKLHEDTYCSPMYQQLALYKMLAARNAHHSFSPHATTSKLPNHLDFPHSIRDILDPSSSTSPSKGTTGSSASFRPEILQPTSSDVQALHDQIRRLQRDLHRAQSQLEEEKILRVERLRKASERCLELMTLSELGEGKVEVLRMKLKAERELREKLEEELESMRAADTARTKSQH